uniref:Uncharacterized protein n=1 Tax=Cryptomonas curvata TaxID=233186 RepID=A0A7S0MZJ1_9CRYP
MALACAAVRPQRRGRFSPAAIAAAATGPEKRVGGGRESGNVRKATTTDIGGPALELGRRNGVRRPMQRGGTGAGPCLESILCADSGGFHDPDQQAILTPR